ncbi:hypothetical protein WDR10_11205 [Kurthia gibsonii]|uniref:hypothetical protein n=1 Tax=Kurthia gibsonii TaxID=33946 RepID=UPI0030D32920
MTGKITSKYSYEISKINQILNELKNGNYYENTQSTTHGSLEKNIVELQSEFSGLLEKIDNDVNSDLTEPLHKKKEIEGSMSK